MTAERVTPKSALDIQVRQSGHHPVFCPWARLLITPPKGYDATNRYGCHLRPDIFGANPCLPHDWATCFLTARPHHNVEIH